MNGSTRSCGGNGGITSDGGEGYTNLPVMGCGNFTTTRRNLTILMSVVLVGYVEVFGWVRSFISLGLGFTVVDKTHV
jgi:hypothetical protein